MAAKTAKAIELRCPECGAMCAWTIDTSDLATVECQECNEKIDPADAVKELHDQAER